MSKRYAGEHREKTTRAEAPLQVVGGRNEMRITNADLSFQFPSKD